MKHEPLPPSWASSRKALSHRRADLAYEAIKRKLISGDLQAGVRVDVNILVDELSTSRQPVLAAVNRLAAEGFLRVVPQVGCWVAKIEAREVGDFFRVFALCEGVACELAAMRGSDKGVARLRANLAQTEALVAGERDANRLAGAFFGLNREFHGIIHEMAGSGFVAEMASSMWDRCDFYLSSADRRIQGERAEKSVREHGTIVAAIARRDAAGAAGNMAAHVESFGAAALQRLAACPVPGGSSARKVQRGRS